MHGEQLYQDMTELVKKSLRPEVENLVKETVRQELKLIPSQVTIKLPDGKVTEAGVQHKSFKRLCEIVGTNTEVFLVGPSGSGKTAGVKCLSKAFNLKFYCQSMSQQTPVSFLLGFVDATGKCTRTLFRDAYEFGGVYLMDEIDNGNPNTIAVMNAAIGNSSCSFPDKMVERNKDFRFICAGNTFGLGATRDYVGRCQLDAATLDRFVTLEWDYDFDFEKLLVSNQQWVKRVQTARQVAELLALRVIISMRTSIYGSRLLELNIPHEEVEDLTFLKGLDLETKSKFRENLNARCGKWNNGLSSSIPKLVNLSTGKGV